MRASTTAANSAFRAFAVAVAVAAWSGASYAEPPPSDPALAEQLFREGKTLMAAHDYKLACPKLAESNRIDPGGGTLLALAVCHEGEGKTATAWAEFAQVMAASQHEGRADREQASRERMTALEPKLSRLTIAVAPEVARTSGLEVRRDGVAIGAAAWGSAVPVDPGEHTIEATAPGKKRKATVITMAEGADGATRQTVTIDALEDDVAATSGAGSDRPRTMYDPGPADVAPDASGRRIAGIVVGGAGLVALGIGTFFGVRAINESHDAKGRCNPAACADPEAVRINADAGSSATIADATIAAGILATAVGAYLLLTKPRAPVPAMARAPARLPEAKVWVDGRSGGLIVKGTF